MAIMYYDILLLYIIYRIIINYEIDIPQLNLVWLEPTIMLKGSIEMLAFCLVHAIQYPTFIEAIHKVLRLNEMKIEPHIAGNFKSQKKKKE